MEEVPCLNCGTFFVPRNRNQNYRSTKECQKARKAAWQRNKLCHDAEYRENQRISQKKWRWNNHDYWKQYRQNNPDKTAKNRTLQRIRNKRRTLAPSSPAGAKQHLIAKMDARNFNTDELSGQYWLVPLIAKMDAVKIYIHAIPGGCK